jgi:signal transduction histidine kinase
VSQAHTQQLGLLAVNRAFSRFAHVTGYACLVGAVCEVAGYQAAAPTALIWPVLLLLLATLGSLVLLDRWRTTFYSVIFLILGTVSQFWLSVVLLAAFGSVRSAPTLILSLVAVSMVLVCGPGFVPTSTIIWGVVGFVLGQGASIVATLATRSPFHLEVISVVVVVGLVLVESTDAVTRSRRVAVRPELDQAVLDDELSVLRYRTELRAAALMHDTILGHLAAIAASSDGPLPGRLSAEIERDLTTIVGQDWLLEPSPAADESSRSDWRRSALMAAVREARDLSLTVDVTGDPGSIARLTPERDVAVGLAAKQCLVNVLRHAQVERAEVVIIGSESDISVMIIDSGRGFSEELVASDRLGLRQSVRRRIESVGGEVQLWSTPGRGTSILIRVPAAQAAEVSDE